MNRTTNRLNRCLGLAALALALGMSHLEPSQALDRYSAFEAPTPIFAFEVKDGEKTIAVTVSDIEALGLYQVTTTSPWEDGEFTFQGVLFRDLLESVGMDDAPAVTVRAIDNFTQNIPREDWVDAPLILATRQDGKLLTRRMQGPTRLVYPVNDYPDFDTELHKPRWVWLIASIERARD